MERKILRNNTSLSSLSVRSANVFVIFCTLSTHYNKKYLNKDMCIYIIESQM